MILNLLSCFSALKVSYETFPESLWEGVCLLALCISCSNNCISPLPLSYLCFKVLHSLLRGIGYHKSLVHGSPAMQALWKNRWCRFPSLLNLILKRRGVACRKAACSLVHSYRTEEQHLPHNPVNDRKLNTFPSEFSVFRARDESSLFINLAFEKGRAEQTDIGRCRLQPRGGVKVQCDALLTKPHSFLNLF